jgi:ketosteroid isomerase-like protein
VLEHRAMADSMIVEGSVAYDWGTFTVRGERNGEEYSGGGKYLIVWREVERGRWLMQFDMWNAGPATNAPRPGTP